VVFEFLYTFSDVSLFKINEINVFERDILKVNLDILWHKVCDSIIYP